MNSIKMKVGNIRKKEIRVTAMKCFLNKGFENTTMEDVIREVGMSVGGVYHHYSNTTEMLKDLMIDGNEYRNRIIDDYLDKYKFEDKYENMSNILVEKCLSDTENTKVYALLLQAKKYNSELEDLFQELKTETVEQLKMISKKLGIDADIFSDGFLVDYINGIILSNYILGAKKTFESQKNFLKEAFVFYIKKIDEK
nr:TetR/AcrR family transcriptional regulator [Peptoniphilus indolicus]